MADRLGAREVWWRWVEPAAALFAGLAVGAVWAMFLIGNGLLG